MFKFVLVRNTARLVFAVSIAIQWMIVDVKAQSNDYKHQEVKILNKTNYPNSLELSKNKEKLTKKNESDTIQLEEISILDNIYLPSEPNEVEISDLLPLKIDDIDSLITKRNPNILAMKNKINQSKLLLTRSLSDWYPKINLSANGLPQYLQGEQDNSSTSNTSSSQLKSSISLEIKWNLIDPKRIPEIAAARDTFEKSKASYLITLRDKKLEAYTSYFALQKSKAGISIGKQSLRASKKSLDDSKSRFNAGIGTKLEVLEAETQVARDKQLLSKKIKDQRVNRRALAEILNLPPKINPIAISPTETMGAWDLSLPRSILAAYSFRKELEELSLDISINNSNANSALAAIQPTISIFNTLNTSYSKGELLSESPDMDKKTSTLNNTIGLNASINIFDGGKAKASYKYNKKKAKEAELNFAFQRGKIRKEVEESFYSLQMAIQDIISTNHEINASKEALRLANLRLEAGITTQREVVNNQRDLTEAEVRYTDAVADYNISLAQLNRYTGITPIKRCDPIKTLSDANAKAAYTDTLDLEIFPILPNCKVSPINLNE
tara:strand:- start:1232 stop:2893 length:1662 start_codon:yes stop_codon:yes gene_type:complete